MRTGRRSRTPQARAQGQAEPPSRPAARDQPRAQAERTPSRPTTLLVIAKEPVAGRVKTRLTPYYSPAEAASLAAAALADTLAVGLSVPARRRVLVLDGTPGSWVPAGYEVAPQVAGGLDERLAAAFGLCDGPAFLVGMDTPQLSAALLAPAFADAAWRDRDAFFGPAADGGFWGLGLADPRRPELLRGVPMSTDRTGAVQRARLTEAGLRVHDLPVLRDVDTPQDADEVARLAPHTRFARTVGRLTAPDASARARRTHARSAPADVPPTAPARVPPTAPASTEPPPTLPAPVTTPARTPGAAR